ncbi:glycosyltransferase [Salarchaeum sp. JOR-1]|uniref:glycosyltransferase n=1 Tax=Salarchaeum sp. JOR-1 TaxID=2599399 RepID=UPI00143D0E62|nr:glycosyltransferase [Salarchaeum sp. JOR-1]
MEIAFLTNYFPKISETFIINQVIGLLERGHSVQIFALESPDEDVTHEVIDEYDLLERTTYFPSPENYFHGLSRVGQLIVNYPASISQVLPSFRRGVEGGVRLSTLYQFKKFDCGGFDVYHAHFGQVGKRWDFLPDETDAPYVVSFYGKDASVDLSERPETYEHTFNVTDCVTVLSEDMREDVVGSGCPAEKTTIQPLPVDLNQFSYSPTNPAKTEPTRILTVARFTEKKGLDDALEAIDSVAGTHDITWTIAGGGPLRDTFETEIQERGLETTVEMLGWVTQERINELLHDAHLFILPSKTSSEGDKEGTPTVLLEAQAAGVPVLSTYHAGIPEIVRDGETGILVPESDPEKLTNALDRFLSTPETWTEMARNGREFVEENHSKQVVAEQLEELYLKQLNS